MQWNKTNYITNYTHSITLPVAKVAMRHREKINCQQTLIYWPKNMNENFKSFHYINKQIAHVLNYECFNSSEVMLIKRDVQEIYDIVLEMFHEKSFFNFGLWDKKIYEEYLELNVDTSSICNLQSINSQLLLYTLIRPLIKLHFFDKKLLDVGSGTGIGLKLSSKLLQAQYALGIDLVNNLVTVATNNFYDEGKVNYIQSDAEHLPLKNESFDVITNLESSHNYPVLEHFFSEVERVLTPGGFFCYSDIYVPSKQQTKRLEAFIKTQKNLKIIQKCDLTKMVQAATYQRLIVNEYSITQFAYRNFGNDCFIELPALFFLTGLAFLPWWQIRLKNPELRDLVKMARKISFWYKKNYFYYLIQKSY